MGRVCALTSRDATKTRGKHFHVTFKMFTNGVRCRPDGAYELLPHGNGRDKSHPYRDFAPLGRVCALPSRDATKTRGKHFHVTFKMFTLQRYRLSEVG